AKESALLTGNPDGTGGIPCNPSNERGRHTAGLHETIAFEISHGLFAGNPDAPAAITKDRVQESVWKSGTIYIADRSAGSRISRFADRRRLAIDAQSGVSCLHEPKGR